MVMGRSARHLEGVVWALAALLALLLAGCGQAASQDPFAGTWREPDGGRVAVIAKTADGYRVTVYSHTLLNAERSGDRLRAWTELRSSDGEPTGHSLEAVFTHDPATGGLVFTDPAGPGLRMDLVRESDSTAIPSPWSSESPQ